MLRRLTLLVISNPLCRIFFDFWDNFKIVVTIVRLLVYVRVVCVTIANGNEKSWAGFTKG